MAHTMAAPVILFALLLLTRVVTVRADDYDICTYRNSGCTGDEECTDSDVGKCKAVDVDDTLNTLGVIVSKCDGETATFRMWSSDDCSGTADLAGLANGACVRFTGSPETIYFTLKCKTGDCFARNSRIKLQSGDEKRLADVSVGDMVESWDSVSKQRVWSEVFLIQHGNDESTTRMNRIEYLTADGREGAVMASPSHMLLAVGTGNELVHVATKRIKEGDEIAVLGGEGESSASMSRARVTKVTGMNAKKLNVHTMNDNVVVDGVLASVGTDVMPLWMQKLSVTPLKALYKLGLTDVVQRLDSVVHRLYVSLKQGHVARALAQAGLA
ncbi:hypothetical protein FVE85_0537 [Porphyridium purpureum]|uniref:Hint domain-containing protein n=1 Tax=Porphyridium purpureum TaxID=35688 RepID=A0A5J4YHP9_PORPP|nr:hypothetical protein FVE85_3448 [Porphyridium purpureum]KAA8496808.1 hypothetical protein FVE85_0537 [Porphyridium purpureum]|eukprot:POR7627..scf228_30